MKTAQQAVLRHQSGITDVYVFVFCGDFPNYQTDAALEMYGFPCAWTKNLLLFANDPSEQEFIEYLVKDIIATSFPSAIARPENIGSQPIDIWWSGIEVADDEWYYTEDYANILPDSHRNKAPTWLAILKESFGRDDPDNWVEENGFKIYAATLCEWLHGFEAASGNDYNHFDANEVCTALEIDDFYLGFLLKQLEASSSIYDVFDGCDSDISEMRAFALKQATSDERQTVRNALSTYFGGDAALYFTLYSSIWPKYSEPMADLCNALVNQVTWDEIGENMQGWEFVSSGWTDEADAST